MAQNLTITLSFDDSEKVILAGQDVSGQLNFTLTEEQSFKRIEIKLSGGAHVKWHEYVSNVATSDVAATRFGEARETYVEDTEVLWRSSQSPDGKIGPGTFSLPFSINLPTASPGSFKGKWGDIIYFLTGKIVSGQLIQYDQSVQLPIRVRGMVDINLPHFLLPAQQLGETEFSDWCCRKDGELKFTANLSRSGCCIGENFPLTVDVNNSSSQAVKMRVSITRKIRYNDTHVDSETKEEESKLVMIVSPDIAPYSQYTWNVDNLIVPTYIEPTIIGSEIIKMEDALVVSHNHDIGQTSTLIFPITVGNVPFKNYQTV